MKGSGAASTRSDANGYAHKRQVRGQGIGGCVTSNTPSADLTASPSGPQSKSRKRKAGDDLRDSIRRGATAIDVEPQQVERTAARSGDVSGSDGENVSKYGTGCEHRFSEPCEECLRKGEK